MNTAQSFNLYSEAKTFRGLKVSHLWNNRLVNQEAINLEKQSSKEKSMSQLLKNPYLNFVGQLRISFSSQVTLKLPSFIKFQIIGKQKSQVENSRLEYFESGGSKIISLFWGETLVVFDEETQSRYNIALVEAFDAKKYDVNYFKEYLTLTFGFLLLNYMIFKSIKFSPSIEPTHFIENKILSKVVFLKPKVKTYKVSKIEKPIIKRTKIKPAKNKIIKKNNKVNLNQLISQSWVGQSWVGQKRQGDLSSSEVLKASNKMTGDSLGKPKGNLGILGMGLIATESAKRESGVSIKGIGGLTGKQKNPGGVGVKNGLKNQINILSPTEEIETSAKISKAFIRRRIRAHKSSFSYCYKKALNTRSDLSGKILIRFDIMPSGNTENIKILKSSLGNNQFHQCLLKRMGAISFKGLENNQVVEVTYPFVFSSGG